MSNQQPELGKLIADYSQRRDAIHIAVAPVTAACKLRPGQHIGFVEPGNTDKVSGEAAEHIGIVDPFLARPVEVGARFWMCLYPKSTINLRHDWDHPSFIAALAMNRLGQADSRRRLEKYAGELGVTLDDLIIHARQYAETGEYWNEGEKFDGAPSPYPEFWDDYHALTGLPKPTDEDAEHGFTACAC